MSTIGSAIAVSSFSCNERIDQDLSQVGRRSRSAHVHPCRQLPLPAIFTGHSPPSTTHLGSRCGSSLVTLIFLASEQWYFHAAATASSCLRIVCLSTIQPTDPFPSLPSARKQTWMDRLIGCVRRDDLHPPRLLTKSLSLPVLTAHRQRVRVDVRAWKSWAGAEPKGSLVSLSPVLSPGQKWTRELGLPLKLGRRGVEELLVVSEGEMEWR